MESEVGFMVLLFWKTKSIQRVNTQPSSFGLPLAPPLFYRPPSLWTLKSLLRLGVRLPPPRGLLPCRTSDSK